MQIFKAFDKQNFLLCKPHNCLYMEYSIYNKLLKYVIMQINQSNREAKFLYIIFDISTNNATIKGSYI